jgi:tetratricopeptide (TPR) repeat protein
MEAPDTPRRQLSESQQAEASRLHTAGLQADAAGDTKKALRYFEDALKVRSDHVPSLLSAADMKIKLNDPVGVLELCHRASAIDLTPEQAKELKKKAITAKEALAQTGATTPRGSLGRIEAENAAKAAKLYTDAKNPDSSPNLRKEKLMDAIKLWNGCPKSDTIFINLAKACTLLAELKTVEVTDPTASRIGGEFVLESKLREYYFVESVRNFAHALIWGSHRDDAWKTTATEGVRKSFAAVSLDAKIQLEQTINELPNLPITFGPKMDCMYMVARGKFNQAIALCEDDGSKLASALNAFREAVCRLSARMCTQTATHSHAHARECAYAQELSAKYPCGLAGTAAQSHV